MQKVLLVILFVCTAGYSICQSTNTDSLFQRLASNAHDTDKVLTMCRISRSYFYSNVDTSKQFAQKALDLSRKIKYKLGEGKALTLVANLLSNEGKFAKALEMHFHVLQISEDLDDPVMTAACYNNIALIYETQHDYRNSLENYLKAKEIYKELADNKNTPSNTLVKVNGYLITTVMNVGSIYEMMDKLDSALYYQNEAYELAIRLKDNNQGTILVNLGNIYFKLREYGLSESNYRSSIPHLEKIDDKNSLAEALLGIAEVFANRRQADSSLVYAKASLAYAKSISYARGIVNAALSISKAYDAKQKTDSAYYFYKMSVVTRDSIFNDEVVRQVQTMNIVEQLRQKDKAEALLLEKKARNKNLQMMGIAIFIITFFGILVMWSKRKVKPKSLKYLGLLGLLLVFEFITYLLHPYVTKITNNIPALIVFASVILASALLPLHHRLEHWVEKELTHKKKRVVKKRVVTHDKSKIQNEEGAGEAA